MVARVKQQDKTDLFIANYFETVWLDIDDLYVFEGDFNTLKYQRPRNEADEKTRADNWSWQACAPLAVSLCPYMEKSYALVDGQGRTYSAELAGDWLPGHFRQMPCRVYIDLSRADEARLFEDLNHSRNPRKNDIFRAQLSRRSPNAVIIEMILKLTGWGLELETSGHGETYASRAVHSSTVLVSVLRQGGSDHLREVLTVTHDCWFGQHLAASPDILEAISKFMLRYGGIINKKRLLGRLKAETPGGINGDGAALQLAARRALRGGHSGAGVRSEAIFAVIRGIYNKGLAAEKRIPVPE